MPENTMSSNDLLHRFIFEHSDIRGVIISLEKSYQSIIDGHDYPVAIQRLLGELLTAVGLLSTTLKFDGIITLQARGNGPLSMIMVDCTRHHNLRGLAQFDDNAAISETANLQELIGSGHLALTIDPAKGERYQGIVPLESGSLAHCIEEYFERSEQLPTRLWLSTNGARTGGLLLQALPKQLNADAEQNQQLWEHVTQIAETLKPEEQVSLSHQEQLYRLFHQDEVRLFEPTELQFCCSCSRERTMQAIYSIGEEEAMEILSESGEISMDCHFCRHSYRFSEKEIKNIFDSPPPVLH